MDNGLFHVAETTDPHNYVFNKKRSTDRGFFHFENCGEGKIIFAVEGCFKKKIKCFGVAKFVRMMERYSIIAQSTIKLIRE